MSRLRRFLKVAYIFFRVFLDFKKEFILIQKKGFNYAQKKMRHVHEKRARQLFATAIQLEGVLIKLCQFFSARRDIFPETYIKILSSLQDDVPAISFKKIEKVLIAEYGDYMRHFKTIDPKPLASASLGQVHKAVLHSGETVAVKVLKPDIEKIIDTDFAILYHVIRLLSNFKKFKQRADFFNVLDEFIKVTGNELNFRREAHIAQEFKKHFKKFRYVSVPAVYENLCTRKIIVMEYLTGDKISDVKAWLGKKNNPALVTERVIELYMEQMLVMRLIHFDPHPGNILVTTDSRIVLLDFGMSGEITEHMQKGMFDGMQSFLLKDARAFIDMLDDQGFIRKGVNKYSLMPFIEFMLEEVFQYIRLDRESIHTVDFSPVFKEIAKIIYTEPFVIPANWAYIGKTVGVLAGIIATLSPNFKLYEGLRPHMEKVLKENVSGTLRKTIDEAQENLKRLLRLPIRASSFIENLEKGYYKIQVDYSEIHEKIDEVKQFIVRLISFLIFSVSGFGSYLSFQFNLLDIGYVCFGTSVIALGMAIFYRMKTQQEKIEKYFQ